MSKLLTEMYALLEYRGKEDPEDAVIAMFDKAEEVAKRITKKYGLPDSKIPFVVAWLMNYPFKWGFDADVNVVPRVQKGRYAGMADPEMGYSVPHGVTVEMDATFHVDGFPARHPAYELPSELEDRLEQEVEDHADEIKKAGTRELPSLPSDVSDPDEIGDLEYSDVSVKGWKVAGGSISGKVAFDVSVSEKRRGRRYY